MSERGKFEDQLQSKLESFEAPYQPAHWQAYRKKYGLGGFWGFLKLWYLPYLFSSALFATAWFFWPQAPGVFPAGGEVRIDTIYLEKTIRIYDTLVLRDTLYINTEKMDSPGSYLPSMTASTNLLQSGKSKAYAKQYAATPVPQSAVGRSAEQETEGFPRTIVSKDSGAEETMPSSLEEQKQQSIREKLSALRSKQALKLAQDSSSYPRSDSLSLSVAVDSVLSPEPQKAAADSVIEPANEKRSSVLAGVKEQIKAQDYRLVFGSQSRLFSPWSGGTFDTYGGVFTGMGVKLGVNRLELDLAAHYGFMHHEFRNPQALPLERQQQFPGFLSLNPPADYLEIWTQQFMVPMSLTYIPWYSASWTWRSQAGVLGNYLLREQFEYSYRDDDYDAIEGIDSNFDDRRFKFTHLQLGSSISYSYRRKWMLEAGLTYYHPLEERLGLSKLDPAALSLNLGWYWYLF